MAELEPRLAAHADALWEAEAKRAPIAPLTETDPGLTVAEAYAIQSRNVTRRIEAGAAVLGRKIGLTSKAMQAQLGVTEPDFGCLLTGMAHEEGEDISSAELLQPRVESEIAFLLGRDLEGPNVTAVEALTAIDAGLPALEIIDSRIADWKIGLADTVADNASSARYVLGARLTPVRDLDLRLLGVVLTVNGAVVETGAGAAVLGNPARCVAWLANKLAEFGETLEAGDVVLAGAVHRSAPVTAGDSVRAEFARLGSVTTRFVQ